MSRGRDISESDAAFSAGIALKSLDDLPRTDPPWIICWRDRLRTLGRSEEETAIRDALLLTSPGDDPGPAGQLFSNQARAVPTPLVMELAAFLVMKWDDKLASIPEMFDPANQSGRAAPLRWQT